MTAISGAEIEQLLHRFSQPGDSNEIKKIEAQLRDLQLSPQGWEIGDYLLGRDNPTFQFFGAVTFRIKLGTGITELDDITISQISQRVLGWLITSVNRGDASSVLRKLCSTLAFLCTLDRDVNNSETMVRRVIMSLAYNHAVDSAGDSLPDPGMHLETLNDAQLRALLWFLTSLTEEATKEMATKDGRQIATITGRIEANLSDASAILAYCFSTAKLLEGSKNDYHLQIEASFTSAIWIFFAQKQSWIHRDDLISPLRVLMNAMLDWLETSELDEAADAISDIMYDFPSFFSPSQKLKVVDIITGPWAQAVLQNLLAEPADELPRFVRLLLAYTDQCLTSLAESPDDATSQKIMGTMHMLVQGPGFAGVDDVVAVEALEFWTQFVEHIADAEFEDAEEPIAWLPAANAHTMQLFHELWRKIKLPTPEQFKELDNDRSKEFRQFRIDVKELLLAAFPALRTQLTEAIAQLCLQALHKAEWLEVEASLFCLNAISIAEQESEDQVLGQLFGSPLFVQLKEDTSVPARTRATSVDVLGQYAEYFERHTNYLPSVLEFLFASLQSAALAQRAAKAINRLCGSCRSSLVQQLPNFVQAYEQFLSWQTAEVSTKERVIGGVGAIAQALPALDEQASSLSMLIRFIEQDLELARREWSQGRIEEAQVASLTAIRCLASIGKAFQATNDEPLDSGDETAIRQFWSSGPGNAVQTQIFDAIRHVLDMFNSSSLALELHGDIIEAVCNVFRAGFTESKPGPFVFSASSFVDLFSTMQLSTPRLEVVLSATCAFLRSHSHLGSQDVMPEARRLLGEIFRLINSIQDLRAEDNTTGLLDILERFMPRYATVLFDLPQTDLESLLNFPLQCLSIPEPLPKRAAASFWSTLLGLNPTRAKVMQEHLDAVVNHIGPHLALGIMRNVAGGATRGDLDWFVDPLKKFSTRTTQSKTQLEQALLAIDTEPVVGADVKLRFLKQITLAHNISTLKRVITTFWTQCRGIDASYAP